MSCCDYDGDALLEKCGPEIYAGKRIQKSNKDEKENWWNTKGL